jgi:hypothetical protein
LRHDRAGISPLRMQDDDVATRRTGRHGRGAYAGAAQVGTA